MLNLGIESVVVLLVIMGVLCGFGGYAFAQARQRRAGGGRTAAELNTELGEYKDNVTEHFQTTANLLHEMTEQYRSVYEHMAAGAQQLCDPEQTTSQIESLRAGLLPAADAPVAAEEQESAAPPQASPLDAAAGVSDVQQSDESTGPDLDEDVLDEASAPADEHDHGAAPTDEPHDTQDPDLAAAGRN